MPRSAICSGCAGLCPGRRGRRGFPPLSRSKTPFPFLRRPWLFPPPPVASAPSEDSPLEGEQSRLFPEPDWFRAAAAPPLRKPRFAPLSRRPCRFPPPLAGGAQSTPRSSSGIAACFPNPIGFAMRLRRPCANRILLRFRPAVAAAPRCRSPAAGRAFAPGRSRLAPDAPLLPRAARPARFSASFPVKNALSVFAPAGAPAPAASGRRCTGAIEKVSTCLSRPYRKLICICACVPPRTFSCA